MAKIPCLHRCGDIWHYRRRVPDKLRSIIGKTEIWKSLHTKDYSTALQRHQTVSNDVAVMFHNLRQQHTDGAYNDGFNGDILLHKTSTQNGEFQAPPPSDQDGLRTLIKTVVEEVLEVHAPRKPSITLDDLYHRYMDDPARQRSKKTVMTYKSVFKVLVEVLGENKDIGEINRGLHQLFRLLQSCRRFYMYNLEPLYAQFYHLRLGLLDQLYK